MVQKEGKGWYTGPSFSYDWGVSRVLEAKKTISMIWLDSRT